MHALAQAVDALASRLKERGLSVEIGSPTGAVDIAVWPWRLTSPFLTGLAKRLDSQDAQDHSQTALRLDILLVSNGSGGCVDAITQATLVAIESPFFTISNSTVRLTTTSIATEELAALFSGAGVKLVLSAAFVLDTVVEPSR